MQAECGRLRLGPYEDQEDAIAKALVAVRETRPSRLKISKPLGEWWAEVTYADDPAS